MNSTDYNPALLKSLREHAGLSKAEVARRTEVAWLTIHRVECGEMASFEILKKLCSIYGVPVGSIFHGQVTTQPALAK